MMKASSIGRVTELMQHVDHWRDLIKRNAVPGTVREVVIRAPGYHPASSGVEMEQHEAHAHLLTKLKAAEDELRSLGVIIE